MSTRKKDPRPRTPGEQLEIMETVAAAFTHAEMPIQALWRRFHEDERSPEHEELRAAPSHGAQGPVDLKAQLPRQVGGDRTDDPEQEKGPVDQADS